MHDCRILIISFYLVDRGQRHRLPGGRTTGLRGWFDRNCPHRARSLLGDHKLEEPFRGFPTGLGIDPKDPMPTTTSSKSMGGSFTIATITLSRSFLIASFDLIDRGAEQNGVQGKAGALSLVSLGSCHCCSQMANSHQSSCTRALCGTAVCRPPTQPTLQACMLQTVYARDSRRTDGV